jgi:2,4-dienoyl-CoA reductase-like NADH-dependent reductase (Old Yellow Enzyme family)
VDDDQVPAHRRIVDFLHSQGALAAVQLAHAGGKASTGSDSAGPRRQPGRRGGRLGHRWAQRPSTVPELKAPQELSVEEIADVVRAFAEAAARADRAGYDVIQLHGAHGYLIHQFLSPKGNDRTDAYGGSEENRTRFVREVADAVRRSGPRRNRWGSGSPAPTGSRTGGMWEASARLARDLVTHHGITWIDVSSGGFVGPTARWTSPWAPPTRRRLAARVRQATGPAAVVSAVGLIEEADQAESLLTLGAADAISIGRAALRDPHWAASAAKTLRVPAALNPIAEPFTRGGW